MVVAVVPRSNLPLSWIPVIRINETLNVSPQTSDIVGLEVKIVLEELNADLGDTTPCATGPTNVR